MFNIQRLTLLKFNLAPSKRVVGRLLSYWEGNFSGAMLNFGRVMYGISTYMNVNVDK